MAFKYPPYPGDATPAAAPTRSRTRDEFVSKCFDILVNRSNRGAIMHSAEKLADLLVELTGNQGIEPAEENAPQDAGGEIYDDPSFAGLNMTTADKQLHIAIEALNFYAWSCAHFARETLKKINQLEEQAKPK